MSSRVSSVSFISSQQSLSAAKKLRNIEGLQGAGLLPDGDKFLYAKLGQGYDIGISDHVVSTILDMAAPQNDPVGRQYIPTLDELNISQLEQSDPIGDDLHSPVRGVVHRYPDRSLLKITNICAVYCRYCFRREMVGALADHLSDDDIDKAINYISEHKEIAEVILTGGDPLVLSARRLQKTIDALNKIQHLQIIRIHTRVPIANPSQVSDTMLGVLKSSKKPIYLVLHINHAQEISDKVEGGLTVLRKSGCILLSQSVLLRGVNDSAKTLEALFRGLVSLHIKPYYLHHMDRAKGTAHFYVPLEEGRKLMQNLRGRVSGIALPNYVLDIPGGYGKVPVNSDYIKSISDNIYEITDYRGQKHIYKE